MAITMLTTSYLPFLQHQPDPRETRLIDTDKMKAAFVTTPAFCRGKYTAPGDDLGDGQRGPIKLCAIAALVAFAGVEATLIHEMQRTLGPVGWVACLGEPVLETVYGIPKPLVAEIIHLFDGHATGNEWHGIVAVMKRCHAYNRTVLHNQAIAEDCARFPQHAPASADRVCVLVQRSDDVTVYHQFGEGEDDYTTWHTGGLCYVAGGGPTMEPLGIPEMAMAMAVSPGWKASAVGFLHKIAGKGA